MNWKQEHPTTYWKGNIVYWEYRWVHPSGSEVKIGRKEGYYAIVVERRGHPPDIKEEYSSLEDACKAAVEWMLRHPDG